MLKAMIVDDEAPARSELKFLLDELGQTEVVAEAASVREAIEKLKEYPCDVMFLDVNMPEATGLQLAEALQHLKFPPAVVFDTAYSEFALDAFKVNAIDYLVKPVETDRLSQAITRVREHVQLHAQAQKSERIPVEKAGKKILISIDKIRFVMARDDYAYLQTDTDRYFSTVSLAQLEPAVRRKLMAMGLLPSSEIRFIRQAPMGDPLQIATSSITLSVQKALANLIEVQAV